MAVRFQYVGLSGSQRRPYLIVGCRALSWPQ
jgi:hypothetical protein